MVRKSSSKGKGTVADSTAFLPQGRTLTFLKMYNPRRQIKIPNRWNVDKYIIPEQEPEPEPEAKQAAVGSGPFKLPPKPSKIVKTPDSQGAGSRFMHKRHPSLKPVKFGPIFHAAQ